MSGNQRRKPKRKKRSSEPDHDPTLIGRRGLLEIVGGATLLGGGLLYGKNSQTSNISQTSTLQEGTGWTISHGDVGNQQQYTIELNEVLAEDAVRISYDPDTRESQSLIIDSGGRELDEYATIVLEEPADPLEGQATLNFQYEQDYLF